MLKQRVISAVILAIVVVAAIFHTNPMWMTLLFALILFIGMTELVKLTISQNKLLQISVAAMMTALFWWAHSALTAQDIELHAYVGALAWIAIVGGLFAYKFSGNWSLAMRGGMFVLSSVLIWICINTLVFVHAKMADGAWMLIYILTLVWVADIGAYFSGRRFGKHKLAPGISPGKTWEGVAGGIALNLVWISLIYALVQGWGLGYLEFVVLGLVTSMISVVGDLYESILKREAGMKDSGRILPGHGGVLDRIDSVIAAAPMYVSGLFVLGAV